MSSLVIGRPASFRSIVGRLTASMTRLRAMSWARSTRARMSAACKAADCEDILCNGRSGETATPARQVLAICKRSASFGAYCTTRWSALTLYVRACTHTQLYLLLEHTEHLPRHRVGVARGADQDTRVSIRLCCLLQCLDRVLQDFSNCRRSTAWSTLRFGRQSLDVTQQQNGGTA